MVVVIYYISHLDKNLIQSRGQIVKKLNGKKFIAICPIKQKDLLDNFYNGSINWSINKSKLIDLKAILELKNILNNIEDGSVIHIFTLKSGFIFMLANFFCGKNFKCILSVNGLGYLFSNNLKAKILKFISLIFFKVLINKTFDSIIFQNNNDMKVFTKFSSYKKNSILIESSGIEPKEYKLKYTFNKELNILLSSRLLKDKGIYDYIKIAESNQNKAIKFYLSGELDEGNPKSISVNEFEKIKNNQKINFLGYLDLKKELHNFDVMFSLSKYEGFSRVLLESVFVGLYCLSLENAGTKFLENFENTFLIKKINKNEILELLESLLISKLIVSDSNREIIYDRYSSEIIANRYSELYSFKKL